MIRVFFAFFMILCGITSAQNQKKTPPKKKTTYTKKSSIRNAKDDKKYIIPYTPWSIHLETILTPISSYNSKTIYCYQGQLGFNYLIKDKIQLGVFSNTLLYYQNIDISNIDSKIIDLSSVEYNTVGVSTGYQIKFNQIIFTPRLDLGYNFFLAKSLDYPINHKEFLDYRYFSIHPKINVGYSISEGFTLGLNLGYNQQVFVFKGQKIDEFNPNAYTLGLFGSIGIR